MSGSVNAEQRGEALLFDARAAGRRRRRQQGARRLAARPRTGPAASGRTRCWTCARCASRRRRASVDGKLQVRVAEQAGNGDLNLVVPGGGAQVQGRIAPASGGGEIKAQVDDAAALQRWIEGLPGLSAAFGGACGTGQRAARRQLARRMAGRAAAPAERQRAGAARRRRADAARPRLSVPRLDLRLPPPATGAAARRPCCCASCAPSCAGSLAQATLALKGEATQRHAEGHARHPRQRRHGTARTSGAPRSPACACRRRTAPRQPGPWTVELSRAVSATMRTVAAAMPRLEVEASAAAATLRGPVPGTVRIDWEPLRFSRSGGGASRAFRLQSKGRLQGLPMAWAEALGGEHGAGRGRHQRRPAVRRRLGHRCRRHAARPCPAHAQERRHPRAGRRGRAGHAHHEPRHRHAPANARWTRPATAPSTPAGLRQAELRLDAEGDTVRANLAWDSERAGEINAEASTRVQQRAGRLAMGRRCAAGRPRHGAAAQPGRLVDARAAGLAHGRHAGGRCHAVGQPRRAALERHAGAPTSSRCARWSKGWTCATGACARRSTGDRVEITEFTLKGGAGSRRAHRRPERQPEHRGQRGRAATAARSRRAASCRWGAAPRRRRHRHPHGHAGPAARAARAGAQPTARSRSRAICRRGWTAASSLCAATCRTDRAVIILPDETAPSLGSDVVVRSAAMDREAARSRSARPRATERRWPRRRPRSRRTSR